MLRDEGHDPDDYMFEINTGKGRPGKPVSPAKASKEQDKTAEKDEEPVKEEEPEPMEEDIGNNNNNNNSFNDEDELIIKDELDNDCFEEVDRIGDVEKVVRAANARLDVLSID